MRTRLLVAALMTFAVGVCADAAFIALNGGRGSLASGGGGGGGTSDLAVLAASMASNTWCTAGVVCNGHTFTMGGLDASVFTGTGGSDHSCGEFAGRMNWDPLHKRLAFVGTSHTGGSPLAGSGCFSTWDDATNQWSRETCTWNSDGEQGHAYMHTAVGPDGALYHRRSNERTISKRAWGASGCASWLTGIVADIGGDYFNQYSGGLEWFPDLNSGAGGLVFCDTAGFNWTNAALTSWSTQSGDSFTGAYDNNIAYVNGFVYCGGGQGSTAINKLSPAGVVTPVATLPFSPGQNTAGGGAMLAAPNNNGMFLLEDATNGDFRFFNGATWSDLGSHQVANNEYFLCGSIPTYGVILCVTIDSAGTDTPVAKVYKQ